MPSKGILYAAGAYTIWGLLPLFWYALNSVAPIEVLAHRIVWALVTTLLITAVRSNWAPLLAALRNRRIVLTFTLSTLLLTANWFIYIWAVHAGFVVETSLGYFINPLVNVAFGMLFLKERLRAGQIAAIVVACAGVLYLTFSYGSPPWIALLLAGSFGWYGLIRKTAPLGSLEGLTLETIIVALPSLAYLLFLEWQGVGSFAHADLSISLLLAASGIITAMPLLLFAAGARQIPMVTLGILQYIAPTLQFLLGVFVFHEVVSQQRLIGFGLVWCALVIYTIEVAIGTRRMRLTTVAAGRSS
ncbi:MAG: EamA family transporter RarD [Roseiflexaceae bacterium]